MTITARHALVTGGSRGIGRGIALKLADHGVHVAINYLKDEASAKETLEQVRARGSDGFTVQADVCKPQRSSGCSSASATSSAASTSSSPTPAATSARSTSRR